MNKAAIESAKLIINTVAPLLKKYRVSFDDAPPAYFVGHLAEKVSDGVISRKAAQETLEFLMWIRFDETYRMEK